MWALWVERREERRGVRSVIVGVEVVVIWGLLSLSGSKQLSS